MLRTNTHKQKSVPLTSSFLASTVQPLASNLPITSQTGHYIVESSFLPEFQMLDPVQPSDIVIRVLFRSNNSDYPNQPHCSSLRQQTELKERV